MGRAKLYNSDSTDLFKISRTGVQLFLNCPRCFYLKNKLGISQISGPPFSLNTAVNDLLVNEFDYYRKNKESHPLMIKNNIDAIPFDHAMLDQWRHNFTGVQYEDHKHNFLLYGAIDDVWIHNQTHELIIVDYKATSKDSEVSLDADWQIAYKNQIEFYQWLMRKNGFQVQNEGWFVYCNGRKNEDRFDATLKFDIKLLSHVGNDSWIEPTIVKIKDCLDQDDIPDSHADCQHCNYVKKNIELLNSKTI